MRTLDGRRWAGALLLCPVLLFSPADGARGACSLDSPAHRVALLELYTSEGCNSCPPADRWLSALAARGYGPTQVVPLAFHVDYWNQLGWSDRFSDSRFSERQRAAAERHRARVIYTPQLLLNGRDWRAVNRDESLAAGLAVINAQPARGGIRTRIVRDQGVLRIGGEVTVADPADRVRADAWIALFENGLSTEVRAGENAGQALHHDFVVRQLVGPLRLPPDGAMALDVSMGLRSDIQYEHAGVAVFVQRRDSGEVLQAVALPHACWS